MQTALREKRIYINVIINLFSFLLPNHCEMQMTAEEKHHEETCTASEVIQWCVWSALELRP